MLGNMITLLSRSSDCLGLLIHLVEATHDKLARRGLADVLGAGLNGVREEY